MILKITDGKLHTLGEGTLTEFHISKGYKEVPTENILTKEDGSYYEYYNEDLTPDLDKIQAGVDKQIHAEWKVERAKLVDELVVDTDVGSWDANEVAQGRMSRAILSMNADDTTTWVMADNAIVDVTQAELSEALKLAGQAQTAVWVKA